MTDHFITGEGFPRFPKFEFPVIDWVFDPWTPITPIVGTLDKPESHSYTETVVVTGPFAFSTSQEEEVEDWLLSKGYMIEWLDTVRIVSGYRRYRMLSHLRMTGARIYSVTTRVEVL